MTALRFQTGEGHQTSPASPLGAAWRINTHTNSAQKGGEFLLTRPPTEINKSRNRQNKREMEQQALCTDLRKLVHFSLNFSRCLSLMRSSYTVDSTTEACMRDSSVTARVLNCFWVPATVSSRSMADVNKTENFSIPPVAEANKTEEQFNLHNVQNNPSFTMHTLNLKSRC